MTQTEVNKKNYIFYKSIGVCVQCGTNTHAPNRVRCEECLVKNSISREKILQKENEEQRKTRQENHKEYLKRTRAERKSQGLCIYCAKPIAKGSSVFCLEHKIKNQANNDKRKSGITRSERTDYGLCYTCGNPLDRQGRVCQKCADNMTNNLTQQSYNAHWKQDNEFIFRKRNEA